MKTQFSQKGLDRFFSSLMPLRAEISDFTRIQSIISVHFCTSEYSSRGVCLANTWKVKVVPLKGVRQFEHSLDDAGVDGRRHHLN